MTAISDYAATKSYRLVPIVLAAVSKKGSATVLEIMHEAYLTYNKAIKYASWAVNSKLMEYDSSIKKYAITERGRNFLNNGSI